MRSRGLFVALMAAGLGLGSGAASQPGVVTGPAKVIDAERLEVAGTRVRLWGYDAPGPGTTCSDHGKPYDCGADALERLQWWVITPKDAPAEAQPIIVSCKLRGRSALGEPLGHCQVEWVELMASEGTITRHQRWRDLGEELILEGYGIERPAESRGFYAEDMAAAKASHSGVWAGAEWRGDERRARRDRLRR